MKILLRIVSVLVIIWLGLLFTGYGVLTGSHKNVAGIGLQCQYLTARGMIKAQYLHSDSGIIGVAECPILRKHLKWWTITNDASAAPFAAPRFYYQKG